MPIGGGKFHPEAVAIREAYHADGVFLMVVNGEQQGSGVTCIGTQEMMDKLPSILRKMADQMTQDAATLKVAAKMETNPQEN